MCDCNKNGLTGCGCNDNCPYKTSDITVWDGSFTSIVVPQGAGLNEVLALLEEYSLNVVNNLDLSFDVTVGNCLGLAPGVYGYDQVFNAINTQLCALNSTISSIQGDITTIQGDVTTIQGDVSDIQNEIVDINQEIVEIQTSFNEQMPIGSMLMYPVASPPNAKWELCEGQTLDKTLFPDLFASIGYNFGGSGLYFNLPDLRGKFFAGYDSTGTSDYQTIGQGAGENSVTLTAAQSGLPAHTHTASTTIGESYADLTTANTDSASPADETRLRCGADNGLTVDDHRQQNTHSHSASTTVNANGALDASSAHENRPEFIVFPWVIKVLN